jgi:hypothetical protein
VTSLRAAAFALLLGAGPVAAQAQVPDLQGVVEAVTATGERVRLLPGGRWEWMDEKKAEVQRTAAEAERARERGAQGGLLGIGRTLYPGDKDYNRGTLNPAKR